MSRDGRRRDGRRFAPLESPALDWTPDGTPRSTRFDDIYYSPGEGLEESFYTFVAGSGLPERWRDHPRAHFCIAELGFGSGLNFLLTWRAWREAPEPRPDLVYLGVERYPLSRADLSRCLAAWPSLAPLAAELGTRYPPPLPGRHRLLFDAGRVRLDLCWAEAEQALDDLAPRGPLVDAWYLDGFAPARNADMWSPGVIVSAAALSRPGASVTTFTAAGDVRRALAAAGFAVRRVPGHGRKRDALRARYPDAQRPPPTRAPCDTPWDLPATAQDRPGHALVIGGGLAGCSAAFALASRGIAVTLLEAGELAGAGSGNGQGVLYTRLSHRHSALADFALASFCFSARLYAGLFEQGALQAGRDGELCGMLQQSEEAADFAAPLAGLESLVQAVGTGAAGALLGVEPASGGWWFPGAGWLSPPAVCRALTRHPGIEVREGCGPLSLGWRQAQWEATGAGGLAARAPCAVIAAGAGTPALAALDWLPLGSVRGQTTDLPALPGSGDLRAVLCHSGYIAPASGGRHCIGASFAPHDTDPALRAADHAGNLAALAAAVPAWRGAIEALDPRSLTGRVGFRCTTPDYLPAAGPVPDRDAFLADYAGLRNDARQVIPRRGACLPGLYVSAGHGSRGLTSTPLAAELLASAICHEPPPLERDLCRALAPARFLVRDIARRKA